MAEFQAGEVVVPVVPSAQNFIKDLKKQIVPGAYAVGQDIGKEIQRGISDQLKGVYEPLKEQTRRQQQQAPRDGSQIGGAFAQAFRKRLEAGLKALPKVELDADASAADQKVQELRARLATLSDQTIGVDIDAGSAQAELAAIQRELSAIDGKSVSIDVRTDIATALAELAAVEAGMQRVGGMVARPRVDVDISGALGAIGTISAALAGLAAIPVAATVGAGIAGLAAPLAAAGVGFAGLAAVAVPSISRIGESLKAQEQAQKAATSATSGAAGAAQQAQIQAINLAAAEQRVVDAKRAAKTAEEDLTRARQEAKRAAEDLARAVANAALDEESAALAVEEARQRLAEVQADPKAGELERKRAELDVRQAEQRAKDAQARNKRLQQDQKTADKAGIEGSSQVIAAKKKIEEANKRVEDSERQLRLMQLQQAAAAQQSAAANKQVAGEVVKLSPAAAKLAKQWKSFSKVYEDWQKSLEPDILPVFGRGLKLVQSLLPRLSPLVRGVSVAVGGLLREMQKGLKDPFWQNFLTDLSAAAPKAIFGLGKSFGNIATGIAGVIKAFLPFVPTVVGGIEKATAAFAKWGKGLGESEGFKAFITYVQQNAPKVIQVVKNIWTVLTNLFSGLSGPGAGALDTVVSITDWLASLSPETLKTFALAALGVVAAFKTWNVISTAVGGVVKSISTVKTIWSGVSTAAGLAAKGAQLAARGITGAITGIGKGASKAGQAVWTGIQSAATKSASVAKTAASGIATAARTAGSAAAKGSTVVWSGIQAAATRAGAAARVAGTAIAAGARAAGAVAAGLGRVALGYTKIAAQALLARTRVLLATAAQVAVKAATAAWTAVQWLLNAALNANPIGLIVLAIAALVAGLIYAYQNSETFRNIVDAVFKAIGAAATWLWETILKPAFDGLVALWQNVVGPAVTWLWNTIIKPAFDGIGALIKMVWENIIKPAFTAVSEFILNTLGPKFVWFHTTIVKPVMDKVGEAVRWAWNSVIKPAFDALWKFITETLGPKFVWLHTTIVKPVMDKVGEIISYAWEKIIKPAFNALWTFITETIPNGFKKGVELIGKFWDGLKKIAAAPVEFVVNTVYNNGIAAVWNAVADALKLPKLPLLKFSGFARGGILPGTSSYRQGDDQLVAMRRGEGVYVSEAMRDPYERARLHAVNSAALSGKSLAPYQGFAGGGIIGDIVANGVKWGAEKILDPILAKASSVMGDSPFAQMLINIPKTLVAKVVAFLSEKEAAAGGPGAGKALEFARAQIGKPYEWGGTGPATFDCSGLTMRAWQAGGRGDIPRTSQQQMAWVKPVQAPVPGALGFPHPGHVWMYVNPSTIIEAPQTGLKIRQVAARAAQVIGVPPAKGEAAAYDSGGFLPTGHSLVYNGTGRPEPVLTDQQWQAIQGGARGGDGPMLNIEEFHATPQQSPQAISRELYWLSKRPR